MMKNKNGLIFLGIAIVFGIVGGILLTTSLSGYSILAFTIAGVLLLFAVTNILKNTNPNVQYESSVNDILNTFDSILVKSNTVPSLDGRNIVTVMSIDDLVDAQLEIRKPICYIKQTESCSFILLDEKEAYIYIHKLKDDVVSPVEIAIKEQRIKKKSKEEMDSEMLREIEKTTVVKLSNQKSYKVSPIRKKDNDKKEEEEEKSIIEEDNKSKKEEEEKFIIEEDNKSKKEEFLEEESKPKKKKKSLEDTFVETLDFQFDDEEDNKKKDKDVLEEIEFL